MRKTHDNLLEKFGIVNQSNKIYKNNYYVSLIDDNINIPDYYDHNDVLNMIYELGITKGIERGKKIRSEDFKRLIENE